MAPDLLHLREAAAATPPPVLPLGRLEAIFYDGGSLPQADFLNIFVSIVLFHESVVSYIICQE